MIVISGNSHPNLAQKIAEGLGCECIIANTKKFPDQELRIRISKDLYKKDVIIVQSTTQPTNDNLIELLLLADTAKRAGCSKITAVIPYFGYSRQNRPSYKYGPVSASLVARLIETSGVDKVITIDMHSKESEGFFKIAIQNLDVTDLFVPFFKKNQNYVVVSPDLGGLMRAKILASKFNVDFAIINKNRNYNGEFNTSELIGKVAGKDCIIIDDIIDTGGTICNALDLLLNNGANTVSACVTHAVFSNNSIEMIKQAGFKRFFITDTIHKLDLSSFDIISVGELILQALKA